MKSIKNNKMYTISQTEKDIFLKNGFNIYDDDMKLIETSAESKISYDAHIKEISDLQEEIKKLKEQTKKDSKRDSKKEQTKKDE